MSDHRLALHDQLVALFPGQKVYFRPSDKLSMQYPCVVYNLDGRPTKHANNVPFVIGERYEITHISVLPGYSDSKDILTIKDSSHLRTFTTENLVHDVYRVYIHSL